MDCIYPMTLKDRTVPCGKCVPCLQRKQNDWVFRLTQELKYNKGQCFFLTLTYNQYNVKLNYHPTGDSYPVLCKRDYQLFMKRLRKAVLSPLRFYAIGEYGARTLRPHYHAIIFTAEVVRDFADVVNKCWQLGFTVTKKVVPEHFVYVSKYVSMVMDLPKYLRRKEVKPFMLSSRCPAIGRQFLTDEMVKFYRNSLSTDYRNGKFRGSLPRYYRDKIFDDEMKAIIRERVDEYRLKKFEENESKAIREKRSFTYDIEVRRGVEEDLRRRKDRLFKKRPL